MKDATITSGGTFVDGSDLFGTPFPTACFQVTVTFGSLNGALAQYTPTISVYNVTTSGFDYSVYFNSSVPVGLYDFELVIFAIGY